jgi:hypothetical protein
VDFRVGSVCVHLKLLRKNAAYRSRHFPRVVAIGKQRIVPMVHVPSYRRRPVAVASIKTLAGGSGVANTTSRAASILHGSSCAPLNAVEVPDTFVDEALGASDGHPVGDADPRASRPGPTPSMRFERMVQPEPATTGLVAEKSCLPVDADYRRFYSKMINSRPQLSCGFSTFNPSSALSVNAPSCPRARSLLSREKGRCGISHSRVLPMRANL